MSACEDVREALFLGRELAGASAAHLAACATCREEVGTLRRLAAALAVGTPAPPSPGLETRLLARAAPALAANARRATWRAVARAVGTALVPLPVLLALNVWVMYVAYALLRVVLPDALSLYVVANHALLLAFLSALTYGAVPILAARQIRPALEESHA